MLRVWVFWTYHSCLTSGFLQALWQEIRLSVGNVSPMRQRRRIHSENRRRKYPRNSGKNGR